MSNDLDPRRNDEEESRTITLEKKKRRGVNREDNEDENCWNCKHRAGGALCPDAVDPFSDDNWCRRYEPEEKGPLICAECEECPGNKEVGECPIRIRRRKWRAKIEDKFKKGDVVWE